MRPRNIKNVATIRVHGALKTQCMEESAVRILALAAWMLANKRTLKSIEFVIQSDDELCDVMAYGASSRLAAAWRTLFFEACDLHIRFSAGQTVYGSPEWPLWAVMPVGLMRGPQAGAAGPRTPWGVGGFAPQAPVPPGVWGALPPRGVGS
jgi:hypothetical protein